MVSRLVVIFVPFFNILQVKKKKKKERKRMTQDLDPRKWEAEGTVRRGPSGPMANELGHSGAGGGA